MRKKIGHRSNEPASAPRCSPLPAPSNRPGNHGCCARIARTFRVHNGRWRIPSFLPVHRISGPSPAARVGGATVGSRKAGDAPANCTRRERRKPRLDLVLLVGSREAVSLPRPSRHLEAGLQMYPLLARIQRLNQTVACGRPREPAPHGPPARNVCRAAWTGRIVALSTRPIRGVGTCGGAPGRGGGRDDTPDEKRLVAYVVGEEMDGPRAKMPQAVWYSRGTR